MKKINFNDLPNTDTPINSSNLNQLQTNVENAINGVIESGSNENGKYIKFADGTMICRHTFTKTLSFPIEWGGWYEGTISNVSFPQSFVGEIPDISLDKTRGAEAIVGTVNPTLTGIESATLQRPTTATDVACVFSYIAIGKWK